MKVEAVVSPITGGTSTAERVDSRRKTPSLTLAEPVQNEKKAAPEEVLSKIKDLTEDGTYSVRFEMNKEVDELIIQVVDRDSGKTIRQIPSEELLSVSKRLQDFRGLILNTES